MFQDKTIVCKDCGQEFTFTASEQEFFAEKGFQRAPALQALPRRPQGQLPRRPGRRPPHVRRRLRRVRKALQGAL